jgi:tRNA(Ile)-lysidine synthase
MDYTAATMLSDTTASFDASIAPQNGRVHRLFRRKIRAALEREKTLLRVRKILVGISGGVDSAVLLHILSDLAPRLGFDLVAAHVHHGIRGDEANRDAKTAERLAIEHGVEFHLLSVKPSKGKTSAEHELRSLRLDGLESLARGLKCQRIALAHHLDDQAETFFLRLMSGTDLRGLRGIRAYRPPFWIRPLLGVTREEIVKEARACRIQFVNDSTNELTHARRNFVRKNLFPILKTQLNPQLANHLAELADSFSAVNDFMEEQARSWLKAAKASNGGIQASKLRNAPVAVRNFALQLAYRDVAGEEKALRREQLKGLTHLLLTDGERRTFSLPSGVKLVRSGNQIRFLKNRV